MQISLDWNVPSWCPVSSVSPLSSGEGTLGNYESETDASCVGSKQPKNKFPSRRNPTRPRHFHALFTARSGPPAHFCSAETVSAHFESEIPTKLRLCRPNTSRTQNSQDASASVRKGWLMLTHPVRGQAQIVAHVRVRASAPWPTTTSERRPPSCSFTTPCTTLALSFLTYLDWMRTGACRPLSYSTQVHLRIFSKS